MFLKGIFVLYAHIFKSMIDLNIYIFRGEAQIKDYAAALRYREISIWGF